MSRGGPRSDGGGDWLGHERAGVPRAERSQRRADWLDPVPIGHRSVPLSDRVRRLPAVHRDVGTALHDRDRHRRRGPRRGADRPARARATQSTGDPQHSARPGRLPDHAVRRRPVPQPRLHLGGRRCVRGARYLSRARARPAPSAGGDQRDGLVDRLGARVWTSPICSHGTTGRATRTATTRRGCGSRRRWSQETSISPRSTTASARSC